MEPKYRYGGEQNNDAYYTNIKNTYVSYNFSKDSKSQASLLNVCTSTEVEQFPDGVACSLKQNK